VKKRIASLSNVLPFSGERRTDARSYHGREEPRAPARGVAAPPAIERTAQAFSRCNGWFGSYLKSRPLTAVAANMTGVGSSTKNTGIAYNAFLHGATKHARTPRSAPTKGTNE
jgi:hypothetical protein